MLIFFFLLVYIFLLFFNNELTLLCPSWNFYILINQLNEVAALPEIVLPEMAWSYLFWQKKIESEKDRFTYFL